MDSSKPSERFVYLLDSVYESDDTPLVGTAENSRNYTSSTWSGHQFSPAFNNSITNETADIFDGFLARTDMNSRESQQQVYDSRGPGIFYGRDQDFPDCRIANFADYSRNMHR